MLEISVIVPVYKVEKYIHRCIDSILAQTFTDFELILVDDGSPDSCGRICDEYAQHDDRIFVLHKPNGGLSDARNAGIDYAIDKGESRWITFIDSDDWVAPTYLEELLNLCEKYQADVGVCRYIYCKEPINAVTDTKTDFLATLCDSLCYQGGVDCHAWAKLYRAELFSHYRFPVGMNMEDFYLIPEIMMEAKNRAVTEKTLYYYYINENGILGQASLKTYQDAWKGYEHQIELFTRNSEAFLRTLQINSFIKNIHAAYVFAKSRPTDYSDDDIRSIKEYGKSIMKRYKKDIDFHDEDIRRAAGAFLVTFGIKARCSDIFNHSSFFIARAFRGVYYKLLFPTVKKMRISRYERGLKTKLQNTDFSIVCSNCIGGFIYHRLGLKFLSPTINCFIQPSDFIKFCKNLKHYLSLNLEFVKSEKPYPVAKLDDVTVFFNHSESEKHAADMWNKRKTRVNYDNMYVILYNRYGKDETPLTKQEIIEAGSIKCKNIVVLSDIPYPDIPYVLYIPKKQTDLGELYFDLDQYGIRTFEKKFDFVLFLNEYNEKLKEVLHE